VSAPAVDTLDGGAHQTQCAADAAGGQVQDAGDRTAEGVLDVRAAGCVELVLRRIPR
jgi:hypothetical protein